MRRDEKVEERKERKGKERKWRRKEGNNKIERKRKKNHVTCFLYIL